jgi:hypothetical protein
MNNCCICWLFTHIFTGVLFFKCLTARRLYKSFGIKGLIIWRSLLITGHHKQDSNILRYHKSVLTFHFQFISIGCCKISIIGFAVQCFDPEQSSLLNIRSAWRSLYPLKASTHVRDEEVEPDGATTGEKTCGKTLPCVMYWGHRHPHCAACYRAYISPAIHTSCEITVFAYGPKG